MNLDEQVQKLMDRYKLSKIAIQRIINKVIHSFNGLIDDENAYKLIEHGYAEYDKFIEEEIAFRDAPLINGGLEQCPFCGAKPNDFSHYRCGKPVVKCLKCDHVLSYKTTTIYSRYRKEDYQ